MIAKILCLHKNQEALANEIGVTQMTISKWLRGVADIKGEYISALVRASNGTVTHEELCNELERLAKERRAKKKAGISE